MKSDFLPIKLYNQAKFSNNFNKRLSIYESSLRIKTPILTSITWLFLIWSFFGGWIIQGISTLLLFMAAYRAGFYNGYRDGSIDTVEELEEIL